MNFLSHNETIQTALNVESVLSSQNALKVSTRISHVVFYMS